MVNLQVKTANLADPGNCSNLRNLTISEFSDKEHLPALQRCQVVAIEALKTPHALTSLQASFDPPVATEAIVNALNDITFYVAEWDDQDLDAFHSPRSANIPEIAVGNIFVRKQDVEDLPVSGEKSWQPNDRRKIFHLSWFLMHELCHCLGSVLLDAGIINDDTTPTEATGLCTSRARRVVVNDTGVQQHAPKAVTKFMHEDMQSTSRTKWADTCSTTMSNCLEIEKQLPESLKCDLDDAIRAFDDDLEITTSVPEP
ncbi:hypothetical protein HKX48_009286 [Thoreauomyces humboldtii]|nr:hypothetical protein HKX48_009286 [Thoreauomyces humboldtii]